MKQKENIEDLKKLSNFLFKIIKNNNKNPNPGAKHLQIVLSSVWIDTQTIILLADKKYPMLKVFSQSVYDHYVIHMKRGFINEAWSATENYVRETVEKLVKEKKITIAGRNQNIKESLDTIHRLTRSGKIKRIIEEVKKKLGGSFVEFPTVLDRLLSTKFSKNKAEAKKWRKFFDIFRKIRNACHNGFVCTKTENIKSKWYEKKFVAGKSVQFYYKDVRKITEILFCFFKKIETSP